MNVGQMIVGQMTQTHFKTIGNYLINFWSNFLVENLCYLTHNLFYSCEQQTEKEVFLVIICFQCVPSKPLAPHNLQQ